MTYDPEVDAAYIYISGPIEPGSSGDSSIMHELDESVVVGDFDRDGHLLGLELLGASRLLRPEVTSSSGADTPRPPGHLSEDPASDQLSSQYRSGILVGGAHGPLDWVENYWAACITLIGPIEPATVAALIAVHDLRERRTWEEALDHVDDHTAAFATGSAGSWTFIWEDNGYRAETPGVPERLSADGRATFTMFWNVNALQRFVAAADGRVTRSFDPLFRDNEHDQVGQPLSEEAALDWTSNTIVAGMQLLAAVTATEPADPFWLSQPGARYWTHRTH
jgi:uncharacterized protein YuzE